MSEDLRYIFEIELLLRQSENGNTSLHSKINKTMKLFMEYDLEKKNLCSKDQFYMVMTKLGLRNLSKTELDQVYELYTDRDDMALNYKDFILYVFCPKNLEKLKRDKEKDMATITIKPKEINLLKESNNTKDLSLLKESNSEILNSLKKTEIIKKNSVKQINSKPPVKKAPVTYTNFVKTIKLDYNGSIGKHFYTNKKNDSISTHYKSKSDFKDSIFDSDTLNKLNVIKASSECPGLSSSFFPTLNDNLNNLLQLFKERLFKRGGSKSIIALSKQFRIYDKDHSGTMSLEEFNFLIKALKIDISENDIKSLFHHFDNNEDKNINYEEFITTVMGDMNSFRKSLVMQVFVKIDHKNYGFINYESVRDLYNPKKHPDVILNKKTSDQILNDFIESFELHITTYKQRANTISYKKNNNLKLEKKITKDQFMDYYKHISCSIESDKYFEEMIKRSWKLDETEDTFSNEIDQNHNIKWCQEFSFKRENNISLENMIGMIENNRAASRFKTLVEESKKLCPTKKLQAWNNLESKYLKDKSKNYDSEINNPIKVPIKKPILTDIISYESVMNLDDILAKFRIKLSQRGLRGIVGISKAFRQCDKNRNFQIDSNEFYRICMDYQVGINEQEIPFLFKNFDHDGSGEISYEEFLKKLVGKMNSFRTNLVHKVFEKIDFNKNELIELNDIKHLYDAKCHPDVLSGKSDEETVLIDFMDLFENHFGQGDKIRVNFEEFQDYYCNISMSIDDDIYFEEIINKVWKISE